MDSQLIVMIALITLVVALFGTLALRALAGRLAERQRVRAIAQARHDKKAIVAYGPPVNTEAGQRGGSSRSDAPSSLR